MGCCNFNRNVEICNEIFAQLPIRNVSISKFITNFDLKNKITSTKFQVIINDYLLFQDKMYVSQNSILLDYWFTLYNNLTSDARSIYVCFLLGLLCRNIYDEDASILAKILTTGETNNKERSKEMYYSRSKFKMIIGIYIRMITVDTIEYFKYFSFNPEEYQKELESEWEVEAIDSFVDETFRIANKKDESMNQLINVKEFLKEYLGTLRNDQLIRNEFTIYSKEYRIKNKKVLDLNKLGKKTDNGYYI